jgi:pSer/pThr/pTyr-binding forkhead associated (FHA) protein
MGRGYSLVDLGSTNGTEVNGQRITETSLMNGDVIGVGTTQITFERRIG